MFLTKSFKKTIETIKRHKWLFLLLFAVQLVFMISFSIVQVKYQVEMVDNLKDVIVPLQQANYNETLIQQGVPFMENALEVVQAWNDFKENLGSLLFFSFLVLVVFNGLNWALSHYIIKKQNFLKLWGKFAVFYTGFYLVYLLIGYSIFRSPLFFEEPINSARIMIGAALVFFYFGLLSFSFVNLDFKEIFKKVFWETGIKKFYWVLLTYLIVILILILFIYLFYLAVNYLHILLVILFLVLLVLAINALRIFIINSLREIR